ncbi:hypothetical protein P3T76_011268 [Phytophthora citrophthora]|uniref:Uncharacterized protein n=1 Tax=Phytophthora citrophthora TaxID=4793 RepID=A0AAD9LGN7_9STRA|nr:hypothetical protein P3T76_011268 [Phytophthora citrophthora]
MADAAGDNNASDFALLLVQEWLVACKLESTARCLVDECERSERKIPARMVWNRMVDSLGFGPRSPATGARHSGGDTTVLEALVRRVVEQHQKDVAQTLRNQASVPHQQVVVMSKKRELRFVSKKSLPRSQSATPSNNAPDRSPELSNSRSSPALGFRPKSAMVCKSASGTMSKASSNQHSGARSSGAGSAVQRDLVMSQRPISAASVFTAHRGSTVRNRSIAFENMPSRSQTSSRALYGVTEEAASVVVEGAAMKSGSRHDSSMVGLRASLPHITGVAGPITTTGPESGSMEGEDESAEPSQPVPKLSLEEMSEERLMEQFGSISRCAIKKLRRVLAKSHACTQEFEKSQRTVDKIKARAKLRQLRRVLAEEQTPLLTSTMTSLTSEPCSLCLYVFPKMNLTTKVSYKSIMDLRATWAVANGSATGGGSTIDNDEAGQQSAEAMTHARMTHLYDEASVCAFCSQLLLNFPSYRPSSAERREKQAKDRREALKNLKDLEAKERHDLEKCDPLNYNSYELNSDDDSDVEEVVEVKTDGRPEVIRRRRRQTMRTPVQLGVVSKRLHYDKLRSDSLHMLTLNEWQKIIR